MERRSALHGMPEDERALVAIDLGAESCRVSLLRWIDRKPRISLVHRFSNAPRETKGGLRWDLERIEAGVDDGLRQCATIATEGIRSIAVDGWAVDYVYIDAEGKASGDPYCYRDERTVAAEVALFRRIPPERVRALTGVQLLRINSVYQMYADVLEDRVRGRWLNLPEYILSRLGAEPVAELTNATHTQMVAVGRAAWCREMFDAAELNMEAAPKLVPPGTVIGKVTGALAERSAFRDCALIAPGCHDTASAIAGIAAEGDDWAYISAGTWSLVGTLVPQSINNAEACEDNFTNLCAVGGRVCFHKNVNGMWMLRQCMEIWAAAGRVWTVQELIAAAETMVAPEGLLDVDHPDFVAAGRMLEKINTHLERAGLKRLDEDPESAPAFANLIFHSLAARYAEVLKRVELLSGKRLRRIIVVGGASQNEFLNRLTAGATGLHVVRGPVESSTVGNFATQMAALEGSARAEGGVSLQDVSAWATVLGVSQIF